MMDIISIPFGWIMNFCYNIVQNYGIALILFTLITKILLFPLSIKQHKSTARMSALNPKLAALRKKYANNKEKLNQETMQLYSEENINPMGGCLPLLIQMPILFGLYGVIYAPLTHVLRIKEDIVTKAINIIKNGGETFKAIATNPSFDSRPELYVVDAVKNNPDAFNALGSDALQKIEGFNNTFLGINLGDIPSFAWNILLLIPILSFTTNILLTIYTQRKSKQNNPSAQQMGMGMNAVLFTMPVISAIFTFQFPAGVGLYWIFSTVFSLLQTMLLYKIYSPKRVAQMVEKEKKKNRPSMYERALQAQQAQNGVSPAVVVKEKGDKVSKSAMKEFQRQKLNEARQRMAEKYGDVYEDDAE